jgi:hypothetical protein
VFESTGAAGGRIDLDCADEPALGDRRLEEVGRGEGAPSLEAAFVEETEDFVPIEDDS